MPSKSKPNRIISWLQKIEDGLLISLLLVMIFMAALQIILRNVFSSGIFWGDGFVRVLVLWIGLLGAMIASRDNHHISIDLISRYLPKTSKRFTRLMTACFTTIICGIMFVYSFLFVLEEKEGGMTAFADVPAWICESIMPIAFGVITIRYFLISGQTLVHLFRRPDQ